MQTKICTKCNQEKNISEFNKDNSGKFGVYSICKVCFNNQSKIYRKKNKEQLKIYREKNKDKIKNWREENKNNLIEYRKKYCQENKEKMIIWRKENKKNRNQYLNNKYQTDINFKFAMLLRGRFNKALKKNSKQGSAVKMLGCSIEEFKTYFQSLFTEGMTWENMGKNGWEIDHIRPLASFDLSIPENQEKACHYTNLQPLWWIDNIKKSDKWDDK